MKEIPQESEKLLDKWNGGKAKFWYYKASFSELVLRIEKESIKGNLQVHCTMCISILAPKVSWQDCHLNLKILEIDEILGATFLLWDEKEDIKIKCMGIHFKEDASPIY